MTNILYGRERAKEMKEALKEKTKSLLTSGFLAIVHTGNDSSSAVYVRMKKKFGEAIGLDVQVFGQESGNQTRGGIEFLIDKLNHDDNCLGIILQLPLESGLQEDTQHLCSLVSPLKDVDGLGGIITGLANTGLIDFLPATPAAVINLMQFHGIEDLHGKKIAILGQSNLVGKPLSIALMKRGATVLSFNEHSEQTQMRSLCRQSDIVVSCTGKVHLVDQEFVRDDRSQVIIDVGYGHKDGKAVGDVDFEAIVDKVQAITPVPGGVGPLTVAQLFENTIFLYQNNKKIKHYLGS